MSDEVALEYAPTRFYTIIVVLFSSSALAGDERRPLRAAFARGGAPLRGNGAAAGARRDPRSTAGLLLKSGLLPLLVGIAGGLMGAALASRLLQGLLYGVGPFDAGAFAAAVASLLAVSAAAALIPARRVAAIDPATSLRAE